MIVDLLYRQARRTDVSDDDLCAAVRSRTLELAPFANDNAIVLLCAHAAHEGCRWNYNVGGLKRLPGQPWCALRTHEVVSNDEADRLVAAGEADEQKFPHAAPPGHRAVYFRTNRGPDSPRATHFYAPAALADGVERWLSRILPPGRYGTPHLLGALERGEALAYAYALKERGYYTADRDEYAAALAAHQAKLSATFGEILMRRVTGDEK